ncbi:hypothetical protein DFH27DRAFT_529881 [Peziza echinospora]|nr:hypothetical protein DFH27DRAFT_529881 [Peziza echinospora]
MAACAHKDLGPGFSHRWGPDHTQRSGARILARVGPGSHAKIWAPDPCQPAHALIWGPDPWQPTHAKIWAPDPRTGGARITRKDLGPGSMAPYSRKFLRPGSIGACARKDSGPGSTAAYERKDSGPGSIATCARNDLGPGFSHRWGPDHTQAGQDSGPGSPHSREATQAKIRSQDPRTQGFGARIHGSLPTQRFGARIHGNLRTQRFGARILA